CYFLSNAPATTEIYTLFLHDALPISYVNTQEMDACEMEKRNNPLYGVQYNEQGEQVVQILPHPKLVRDRTVIRLPAFEKVRNDRSEEHTSELQSRENLVCRLLLEKKK